MNQSIGSGRVEAAHDSSAAHGHGASHGHPAHGHGKAVGHVVGWPILAATCLALLVLTAVTYYTAVYINLGEFNIWLAMLIASTKATLVCMFFMHLRWDRPFNAVVLVSSLIFMVLFIGLAMTDTRTYHHDIEWKKADFYSQRGSTPAAPAPKAE